MSIVGWYYLHTNGELIYKPDSPGTVADIRESDFARGLWHIDPDDRLSAWTVLVEGLAAGAKPQRVADLAAKWGCNDADALNYAEVICVKLQRDGNQWCATRLDFVNLQEAPAGFGATALDALANLAKALGYQPSKMWGASFAFLTKRRVVA